MGGIQCVNQLTFSSQIKEEHMEQLVPLLTTEPPLSCRTASEASRCSNCTSRTQPHIHSSHVDPPPSSHLRSVVFNICYEKDNVHMVRAHALLAHQILFVTPGRRQVLAAGAAPPLIAFLGKVMRCAL